MNKMDIDYTAAKFWLDVAQWIGMGLITVWVFLRTKDKDNDQAVQGVNTKLTDFIATSNTQACATNERLTRLEERISHMPTNDELSDLEGKVESLRASVEGMSELLRRVEHQTNIIHEHLLSR
ncbi:DUF2730 family protein [Limnohabitans sp.]|jgi:predicted  nucleic acid-binding Zn-ribbon protein|uniref:DUF2730 family protein n=1 Tax=Limnohabitans sp. TaxID=1907725 RepID=UPI00286F0E93|nr:DUF2730 family protein [Limnohabitans sp.]